MRECENLKRVTKIRFSDQLIKDLLAKGAEEKIHDFSKIVRKACTQYLYKNLNEMNLVYASINDLKQRMNRIEGKLELLCIMQMQQTKKIIQHLPANKYMNDEVIEIEFEKFEKECEAELRKNLGGKIEALVLDIYKTQATEQMQGGKS